MSQPVRPWNPGAETPGVNAVALHAPSTPGAHSSHSIFATGSVETVMPLLCGQQCREQEFQVSFASGVPQSWGEGFNF